MDEIYNQQYYMNYNSAPYEKQGVWVPLFERIAERIIQDFNPRTVLDAGCAMGYLVASLRDRNVEAYGFDISEYAISKVREDIKPFCKVGSLTESLPSGFPDRYDLVVTIEVLEHLSEDDGKKAIKNLCSYSDIVIFSSSPDCFEEETHINVQPGEYWAKEFYKNGFQNMVPLQPYYITDYAACFQRISDNFVVIEEYEKGLAALRLELKKQAEEATLQLNNALDQVKKTKEQIEKTKEQIEKVKERDAEIVKLHDLLDNMNKDYQECLNDLDTVKSEMTECTAMRDDWKEKYYEIDNSLAWKAVKKTRNLMNIFIKPFKAIK